MSKRNCDSPLKMVATKTKHKVLSCSTPEHRSESPSRDSDSICDSEAGSPVPFLCTQDGADGETDVVWNFYTPKADRAPKSRIKNSTPVSHKCKKSIKPIYVEKPLPKRRTVKASQKRTELFQDLIELNQNLHELIGKKTNHVTENRRSGSEEDIFTDSGEGSPRSGYRMSTRCLRRNVLSSKFTKLETETALESDDSMNECLIKASQVVEEKILNEPTPAKRTCLEISKSLNNYKPSVNINIDNDSMDAILNSIKLDSPIVSKAKRLIDDSSKQNDSFDSFIGNLNDSALDKLTQIPPKSYMDKNKLNTSNNDWMVQDIILHDGSPLNRSTFGRHNSMPESPSVPGNMPSTSGMAFGRYNTMPYDNNGLGDSPIKCTQDEIKKKHQLAREKLLAKRLLPFTSSQQPPVQPRQKGTRFQPKVPSSTVNKLPNILTNSKVKEQKIDNNITDLKSLIERKRQEALMKLRRRQPHNNR